MSMQSPQPSPGNSRFGTLLRQWRTERRWSQLNLAVESSVSQRHVSFLESGRAQPSRPMVLQLAEALEVPLRERNTLLQAAGFTPFFRETPIDDALMAPVHEALSRILAHHMPYPAVILDREYNVVRENQAFNALIGLFGDSDAIWNACCADGPKNLLRLTFHPAGARPYIRNFDAIAPLMLKRTMREFALRPSDYLARFFAELRTDESLPDEWHAPDVTEAPAPVISLVLGPPPAAGASATPPDDAEIRLFSMISTFGTPCDVTTDELRVELFFPEDTTSEQVLRQLAAE